MTETIIWSVIGYLAIGSIFVLGGTWLDLCYAGPEKAGERQLRLGACLLLIWPIVTLIILLIIIPATLAELIYENTKWRPKK